MVPKMISFDLKWPKITFICIFTLKMSKIAFRVAGSGNFKTGYKTPDVV